VNHAVAIRANEDQIAEPCLPFSRSMKRDNMMALYVAFAALAVIRFEVKPAYFAPPPTEVSATPWVDPFVYVEVRGSQGDGNRKEQRDIRTK
jgi:hypothetical protein